MVLSIPATVTVGFGATYHSWPFYPPPGNKTFGSIRTRSGWPKIDLAGPRDKLPPQFVKERFYQCFDRYAAFFGDAGRGIHSFLKRSTRNRFPGYPASHFEKPVSVFDFSQRPGHRD